MATLKPEHLAELRKLCDQSLALLDVLAQIDPDFASTAREFRQVVEDTSLQQNLRGMREVARDLRELVVTVPARQRAEVLAHVRRVSGFPLEAEEAKDAAAAERILVLGRIRNDREYYVLRSYLSALEARDDSNERMKSVVAILDSYRSSGADAV